MRHPRRTVLAVVLALLAVAACGDDSPVGDVPTTPAPVAPSAPASPDSTVPEPTGAATAPPSYETATGPDDVVISVTNEGGFVPAGSMFVNVPIALVTGDGRAITAGPVPAIYPGPLLANIQQRSISSEAVQQLLADADDRGLLGEATYDNPTNIADAGTTIVTITVAGTTYRHEAYALGLGSNGESDPARAALSDFVDVVSELTSTVGDAGLGPSEAFRSDQYLIQARPVDPSSLHGNDVAPTFVAWPADAPVRLADAGACATAPAAEFDTVFADATARTFFTEPDQADGGEITYSVTPVPRLPGRTC